MYMTLDEFIGISLLIVAVVELVLNFLNQQKKK